MRPPPAALTELELAALYDAVGEVAAVTYAPPNIYPMSAPVFSAAPQTERPAIPAGPLGAYVHVPFCNYKCTFCFYATRSVPDADEMARYVSALEREWSAVPMGTPLAQLYVGGGTPTALPADLLDRLLASVFARVVPGAAVHTVESSPESVTAAHVEVLRRHGIERVSMGVQTNESAVLDATHRRHDLARVTEAVRLLVGAGFYVNVDLIYGLPGQTEVGFDADFEAMAGLGVHSVTCYNLRVNEKTVIGRRLPSDRRLDLVRLVRWRERARAVADRCGFAVKRWHTFERRAPATAADVVARFRDDTGWGHQFGIGVSARSRLRDTIYRNRADYPAYLARVEARASPVEEVRVLTPAERRLRYVTLTLGDARVLRRAEYAATFGTPVDDDFASTIPRLVAAGLLTDHGDALGLSPEGALVHDLVTKSFYPADVLRWMEDRQRLAVTSENVRSASP